MRIITSILFLLTSLIAFSQKVTNVDFNVVGKDIVITYDLDKTANVTIAVSAVGNVWYYPKSMTGDVGQKIKAGKQKKVIWNVTKDHEEFIFESVRIKVEVKNTERLMSKNEFYIEGDYICGNRTSIGATLGCYIHNINIESSYMMGLGESEPIYWCGINTMPIETTYYPTYNMSAKVGYGFMLGSRFRLTPQVGVNLLKLSEKNKTTDLKIANLAYSTGAIASLRMSLALFRHLSIIVTPEYITKVIRSDGYSCLAKTSSKTNNWDNGFNCKIGLSLVF